VITVGGFNTSVDKTMEMAELRGGAVNRASSVRAYAGGKGLHVARAVATLGEPATLVGVMDAAHRSFFDDALSPLGIAFHGPSVDGVRTCLTIHDAGGTRVTEILEPGPELDEAGQRALCDAFLAHARQSRLAVLSGSVPRGFGDDVYARLVTASRDGGARCLVDASGPLLRAALEARPFLVKPNREELEALLGGAVGDVEGAAAAARLLCARGVTMVVVSLGAEGALLASEGRVCHAAAPPRPAQNTVGSGDCLLAGVAVGVARGLPHEEVLRLGVACGTAQTLSPEHGYVRREDVDAVLPQVRATWLRGDA
jgi:1-phosphofructokinase family hexose kinase